MTIDDYLAIVAVLNRYADVCDTKDFDRFVDVFTADATMDYSTIPDVHAGPREIADNVRRNLGGCGPTQHLLGNYEVEVEGDVARASCKVRAFHLGIGEQEGETFEALATFAIVSCARRRVGASPHARWTSRCCWGRSPSSNLRRRGNRVDQCQACKRAARASR